MPQQTWTAGDRGSVPRQALPDAPPVTGIEWALLVMIVFCALAVFGFQLTTQLTTIIELTFGIELALMAICGYESIRNKVMGKTLLSGSMMAFYYVDAFRMAISDDPYTAKAIQVAGAQFSPETVQLGLLYAALFQLMLFAGYSCRVRLYRLCYWVQSRVDRRGTPIWLLRYLFAACAVISLLVTYKGSLGTVVASVDAARSGKFGAEADFGLLTQITFFGMFGCGLLLIEALFFSKIGRLPLLLLTGVLGAPVFFGSARHMTLFVMLPVIVATLKRVKGRIRTRQVVVWGGLVLLLVGLTQLQFAVRTRGWQHVLEVNSGEMVSPGFAEFQAELYALDLVPKFHDYFLEPIEPFFVIHWIPRKIWETKPIPKSWTYYDNVFVRNAHFNVTPSVIGQFHMNFGLPGVLYIGVLLGFLMAVTDRAMMVVSFDRQIAMMTLLGSFYAFLVSSFRFFHPLYFAYVVFGAFVTFVLTRKALAVRTPVRWIPAVGVAMPLGVRPARRPSEAISAGRGQI